MTSSDEGNEELHSLFSGMLDNHFQRIGEVVAGRQEHEVGAVMLQAVKQVVEEFKAAVKSRGLDEIPGIEDALQDLEYPINNLRAYFIGSADSKLNQQDARIFAFFIHEHVKQLRSIAKEIDDNAAMPLVNRGNKPEASGNRGYLASVKVITPPVQRPLKVPVKTRQGDFPKQATGDAPPKRGRPRKAGDKPRGRKGK